MGILAGILLPSFNPSIHDQLRSAGQIVCSDLAYARDLAVSNSSSYEITFDTDAHEYVLRHSGTNSALDTLPSSAFGLPTDSPDEQTTSFAELPHLGPTVEVSSVYEMAGSPTAVGGVEFGPLGETTRVNETVIWLAAGGGQSRTFLPLTIDPVTGLCSIGDPQSSSPPAPVFPLPTP